MAEHVEVGEGIPVGIQPVVDAAVIGRQTDREALAGAERHHRVTRDHRRARGIQGALGTRHVGDGDVVEAPVEGAGEASPHGVHGRWREAGEAGEGVGAHGTAALHLLAHGEGDLVQAHGCPVVVV